MAQSASEFQGETPAPVGGPSGGGVVIEARSPRQLFWIRFKQDKVAIAGGVAIILMVVMAILAPFWAHVVGHPYDKIYIRTRTDEFGIPLGPNKDFWFGSDDLGRDLLCASCTAPVSPEGRFHRHRI